LQNTTGDYFFATPYIFARVVLHYMRPAYYFYHNQTSSVQLGRFE